MVCLLRDKGTFFKCYLHHPPTRVGDWAAPPAENRQYISQAVQRRPNSERGISMSMEKTDILHKKTFNQKKGTKFRGGAMTLSIPFSKIASLLIITAIIFFAASCTPTKSVEIEVLSAIPLQKYESIEYSNFTKARELLGLTNIRHTSSMRNKIAFFSAIDNFIFSMGEISFLLLEDASLGFDPSDFKTKVVAKTASHSVMVVTGSFCRAAIIERLTEYNYRQENYNGYTLYSLPLTNALMKGGLPLTFSNLTFVNESTIAHAPTIGLLKKYIDGLKNDTLSNDEDILKIVNEVGDVTSFYISSAITATELYGKNSLMNRSPEDWGISNYRLSPYTYFAFGIRPIETGKEQDIVLVIYYPNEESAKKDKNLLKEGLTKGKSLSGLTPLSELFSVRSISAKGNVLKARLKTKDGFDIKLLISLRDLPFLVY